MISYNCKYLTKQIMPPFGNYLCNGIQFMNICGGFGQLWGQFLTKEGQKVSLLGQDSSDPRNTYIYCHYKFLSKIGSSRSWSVCQSCSKFIKSYLNLRSPYESIYLQQFYQRPCNVCMTMKKSSIITCQPQKALEMFDYHQSWPLANHYKVHDANEWHKSHLESLA